MIEFLVESHLLGYTLVLAVICIVTFSTPILYTQSGAAAGACETFKAWGYPWTTLSVPLVSAGFLIASVISDIKHSLFTLVLIATSYPIYFFAVKKRAGHSSDPTSAFLKPAKAEYTKLQ